MATQEMDDLLASNKSLAESNNALVTKNVEQLKAHDEEVFRLMERNAKLVAKSRGRKQAVSQLNHAVLRLKAENQSLKTSLMREFGDHLRQKRATTDALAEIKDMKATVKKLNAKLGDPVDAFVDPDQTEMDLEGPLRLDHS